MIKKFQEIPVQWEERKLLFPYSVSSIKCTPTEFDVCVIPFNIILIFNSVSIVTGLLDVDCAVDVRFHLGIKGFLLFTEQTLLLGPTKLIRWAVTTILGDKSPMALCLNIHFYIFLQLLISTDTNTTILSFIQAPK
jgi:hypothetical protein